MKAEPDELLSSNLRGNAFYVPKFFEANQIGYFDEPEQFLSLYHRY